MQLGHAHQEVHAATCSSDSTHVWRSVPESRAPSCLVLSVASSACCKEMERVTQTAVQDSSEPVVRLWAISDIHTDMEENAEWVRRLSTTAYQNDGLIVAGDVSDCLMVLRDTLTALKQRFAMVWFCPGNHDLWLSDDDKGDSMDKLRAVLAICAEIGVSTDPGRLRTATASVRICPLLSWHHQSFDTEPDIEGWAVPPAERTMTDYRACRFAGLSQLDDSVAAAVDALNGDRGGADEAVRGDGAREGLVTFSHFLPRPELLLEKRFLICPQLPKAAGSRFLGEHNCSSHKLAAQRRGATWLGGWACFALQPPPTRFGPQAGGAHGARRACLRAHALRMGREGRRHPVRAGGARLPE